MSVERSSSAIATTGIADSSAHYRGRFAPSPSGPLHFGSLVAAVGSFLEARTRRGAWLLRIEDLDPPRERSGAADDIRAGLERLGLEWDGPVLRQSRRTDAYIEALARLRADGRLRACHCSRAALAALPENRARRPGDEFVHPPECLSSSGADGLSPAWRFRAPDRDIQFVDRVQGLQVQNAARTGGDFVVRRRDGLFAYQLAVVVDDHAQGVTDVVRGADLLASTSRQILLQEALGLPRLSYMHLPLAVDRAGVKLSKSEDAPGLARSTPASLVVAALGFLRQAPPPGLERASLPEVWAWAMSNWRPQRMYGIKTGPAPGEATGVTKTEGPA